MFKAAKEAKRAWAKTPLWKRAEYLHKVDALMKEHAEPIASTLVSQHARGPVTSLLNRVAVQTRQCKLWECFAKQCMMCSIHCRWTLQLQDPNKAEYDTL